MFEGFLGGDRQKVTMKHPKTSAHPASDFKSNRLQVSKADALLKNRGAHLAIDRLSTLMVFDDEHHAYEKIVRETINNFAEYVQRLPATKSGYFSNHGGILEHALERATTATMNCYRHFMPNAKEGDTVLPEYAIWLFVVFSAALYFRLGDSILKFDVQLFKDDEQSPWHPLTGNMLGKADSYQYHFSEKNYDFIAVDTTKILATHLLPNLGLEWITRDKNTYAVWLALLGERWDEVGSLSGFIPEANSEVILKYFEDLLLQKGQQKTPGNEFKPTQRDSFNFLQGLNPNKADTNLSAQDKALLATFTDWLQKEIANGKITINKNKSIVQILRQGVLLAYHTYFHNFIRANPQYGKWENVLHRFAHMGLIQMNAKNIMVHYHRTDGSRSEPSVLFKDTGLLLTSAQSKTRTTVSYQSDNTTTARSAASTVPAPHTKNSNSMGMSTSPTKS